jgi:hypothetical protein
MIHFPHSSGEELPRIEVLTGEQRATMDILHRQSSKMMSGFFAIGEAKHVVAELMIVQISPSIKGLDGRFHP